uniref:Uncharacterized protein n=1 Tax=uncultured bacterium fosmid pJB102C1 TaxID=1478050 RepID=A0A0H3UA71_9BACT|nr:hypothetical protein [uncultured bacterium fosmid pJB102C1]
MRVACGAHEARLMFAPVAQNEIVHLQTAVVDGYLIEHFLSETDGRCLELDDAERTELSVVDDGIATLLEVGYLDRRFDGYLLLRITLLHEGVEEILAHPLFRRKAHELAAPYAEDVILVVLLTDIGCVHYFFNIDKSTLPEMASASCVSGLTLALLISFASCP